MFLDESGQASKQASKREEHGPSPVSPHPWWATLDRRRQDTEKYSPTNARPAILVAIAIMINAVLVFNNAGQPRLTKFYTQLV